MTPEQRAEFEQLESGQMSGQDAGMPRKNTKTPQKMSGQITPEQQAEMAQREAMLNTFDESSNFEQFGIGLAKPFAQAYYGVKDIFTDLDEGEKFNLQALEQTHGVPAMAGEITGDIASLAIPATGVVKGTQALTKGMNFLPRALAALLGETALDTGFEALKAPETGETRAGNAGQTAVGNVALGSIPLVGRGLARWRMGDEATKLVDEGVRLTAGMGYRGNAARNVEKFLSNAPVTGTKTRALQDRAISDWNKKLLNDVAGDAEYGITNAGREGFKQAQDAFSRRYTDVWAGLPAGGFNASTISNGIDKLKKDTFKFLPEDSVRYSLKNLADIEERILQYMDMPANVGALDQADDLIRKAMFDAPDRDTQKFFKSVRDSLHNSLPEGLGNKLKSVDADYQKFKTIEKAGSYVKSQENNAIFSPRQLESAIKSRSNPSQTTKGRAPLQDAADIGTDVIANVLPERSQISVGSDLGRWMGALGLLTAPVETIAAGAVAKGAVSDATNRALTGVQRTSGDVATEMALKQLGLGMMEE